MNENPIPVLTSPCVPARVQQGVSVDQRHLHKTNLTIKEYIWKKVNIPSILIIVFSGRKPRNYQCEFHCLLFLFIFQIYYINFSFTCYIHVACNCICIVFIRVNRVRRKVVHSTHFCWCELLLVSYLLFWHISPLMAIVSCIIYMKYLTYHSVDFKICHL